MRNLGFAVIAAVALLRAPLPAFATPVSSYSTSASTTTYLDGNDPLQNSASSTTGQGGTSIMAPQETSFTFGTSPDETESNLIGVAQSINSAGYGVLHSYTSASATSDVIFSPSGGPGGPPPFAQSQANGTAQFNDIIHIFSNTEAPGTLVAVTISTKLFGETVDSFDLYTGTTQPIQGGYTLTAATGVDGNAPITFYSDTDTVLGPVNTRPGVTTTPDIKGTMSETIFVPVGGYYDLQGTLTTDALAYAGVFNSTALFVSDIADTAYFAVQVDDPLAYYVADSGTTYLTQIPQETGAVPEPVSLSIFGAGLVGAAAMRRRKGKSA